MIRPIYYKAFSLVELMVAIAIVAVLAAVAVPAYRNYVKTTRISATLNYVNVLLRKAMIEYEPKGSLSASVGGIPLTTAPGCCTFTSITGDPNIDSVAYYSGSHWVYSGRSARIVVNINPSLGAYISGYVQGTTRSRIQMGFLDRGDGRLRVYCGDWNTGEASNVLVADMPVGCQDTNFVNYLQTGNTPP